MSAEDEIDGSAVSHPTFHWIPKHRENGQRAGTTARHPKQRRRRPHSQATLKLHTLNLAHFCWDGVKRCHAAERLALLAMVRHLMWVVEIYGSLSTQSGQNAYGSKTI